MRWLLRIRRVSRRVAQAFSLWSRLSVCPCVPLQLPTLPLWVWSRTAPSFSRTGSGRCKDRSGDVAVTCHELKLTSSAGSGLLHKMTA